MSTSQPSALARFPPPGRSTPRRAALYLSLVALAGALLSGPARGLLHPPPSPPPSIILMIGDGLGPAQIALARRFQGPAGTRLHLESLPVVGLVSNWSTSNAVTDSGAAATAMASGIKTSNARIGMDVDARPVRSLSEVAREKGWRVGYVTTTGITHATPAAFYAHVPDRYADEATIALQLLDHGPDVALGGGLGVFLPKSEQGERQDGRNLVVEAKAKGYAVWDRFTDRKGPRPARLLGLFAWGHLGYQIDEQRYPPERRDPGLPELTQIALDVLARDAKPFFLMVEGGRIDHGAHSFDAATSTLETVSFDAAVSVVLAHQKAHPNTLVLVTADHSTGGLALNDYVSWDGLRQQHASVDWLSDQLRNAGASAELVTSMTGWQDITADELAPVLAAADSRDGRRELGKILSKRHGVTFIPRISQDTAGHTGEDVALYAGGPRAELFGGVLDNAELPHLLAGLLGWSGALSTPPPVTVEQRLAAAAAEREPMTHP